MLPVDVVHPFSAGNPAQQFRLVFGPGEDVMVVEVIRHDGSIVVWRGVFQQSRLWVVGQAGLPGTTPSRSWRPLVFSSGTWPTPVRRHSRHFIVRSISLIRWGRKSMP